MDKTDLHSILDSIASNSCKSWFVSRSDKKRSVFKCKNKTCQWEIGFYLNKNGWNRVRTWNETHTEYCNYDGPSTQISPFKRRQAAILISQISFLSKDRAILVSKLISRFGRNSPTMNKRKLKIRLRTLGEKWV